MTVATEYDYEVQGYYSGQWETLTSEASRHDANEQKKCYDDNEPGTPHRVKRVKAAQ